MYGNWGTDKNKQLTIIKPTQTGIKRVLRIHDILGRIRIRRYMPLTNRSEFGSGSWIRILDPDPAIFVLDLQDASQKLIF